MMHIEINYFYFLFCFDDDVCVYTWMKTIEIMNIMIIFNAPQRQNFAKERQ